MIQYIVFYIKCDNLLDKFRNLDSKTSDEVLEIMVKMNEQHDTTFVFSTHDPQVMDYANRLIEIRDGEISRDKKGEDLSVHN